MSLLALATALSLLGCERDDPDFPPADHPPAPARRAAASPPGKVGHQVDCDPMEGLVGGLTWFTIYDEVPSGRAREACNTWVHESFVSRLDPAEAGGGCRVRWSSEAPPDDERVAFGLGFLVTMGEVGRARRLVLETRGDGRMVRARFPMREQLVSRPRVDEDCGSEQWDFYGTELPCGNGSRAWVPVVIELDALQQEGWGLSRPLELSSVEQVQVFTSERPVGNLRCDVAVVGLVE